MQGRQDYYSKKKNVLTPDFSHIHGKRAHFRDVIVALCHIKKLGAQYWGANGITCRILSFAQVLTFFTPFKNVGSRIFQYLR